MSEEKPLADHAYRPRMGLILLVGGFFGLGVVVLGHKYEATGELEALLAALASGAFVLVALLLLAARTLRPQRVRVFRTHLEAPAGRFGREQRRIALRDIEGVDLVSMSGQVFATLRHPGGPTTLQRGMFPENQDFDAVLALVETGRWSDAPPVVAAAAAPSRPPPVPTMVAAARAGAARPWWGLAMKLGALAAFCGGPLAASDALRPIVGRDPAFAIGFAPIALLLFGTFAVLEDAPTRWTRFVVGLGGLGGLLVAASDGWALLQLPGAEAAGPRGLIVVGSVLGLGLVAAYAWAAARFWRRPTAP